MTEYVMEYCVSKTVASLSIFLLKLCASFLLSTVCSASFLKPSRAFCKPLYPPSVRQSFYNCSVSLIKDRSTLQRWVDAGKKNVYRRLMDPKYDTTCWQQPATTIFNEWPAHGIYFANLFISSVFPAVQYNNRTCCWHYHMTDSAFSLSKTV